MAEKPNIDALKRRIDDDIRHFNGNLPERAALVWHGYLGALIEWGLISVDEHEVLTRMLPTIAENPIVAILLGREK